MWAFSIRSSSWEAEVLQLYYTAFWVWKPVSVLLGLPRAKRLFYIAIINLSTTLEYTLHLAPHVTAHNGLFLSNGRNIQSFKARVPLKSVVVLSEDIWGLLWLVCMSHSFHCWQQRCHWPPRVLSHSHRWVGGAVRRGTLIPDFWQTLL